MSITPIGVALGIFLFFFVPIRLLHRRDLSDDIVRRIKRRLALRKLWRLSLFTVFLICARALSSRLCFLLKA